MLSYEYMFVTRTSLHKIYQINPKRKIILTNNLENIIEKKKYLFIKLILKKNFFDKIKFFVIVNVLKVIAIILL